MGEANGTANRNGNGHGNGTKLGPFKKLDILFLIGIGVIVYGAVIKRVDIMFAGGGIAGVPLFRER